MLKSSSQCYHHSLMGTVKFFPQCLGESLMELAWSVQWKNKSGDPVSNNVKGKHQRGSTNMEAVSDLHICLKHMCTHIHTCIHMNEQYLLYV